MNAGKNGTNSEPKPMARPEMEELVKVIGDFIRYWGFKKIHGRIWCLIYLSEVPLDAGELIKALDVSKASMSLSLRDLLNYDVIKEGPKSDRGTQTYLANPEILAVILNVLRTREKKMLAHIAMCHKMVKELPEQDLQHLNIQPARLKKLGEMIGQAQMTLNSMIDLAELDLEGWTTALNNES